MDASLQLLLPFIDDSDDTLLIADENLLHSLDTLKHHRHLNILTNRYDVFQACRALSLSVRFSDFDFTPWPDHSLGAIYCRVSKEKSVTHHIINQSFSKLKPQGQLIVSGEKSDGIKGYASSMGRRFNVHCRAEKHGNQYLVRLQQNAQPLDSTPLDDKDYQQIRAINHLLDAPLYSKPGVFGWNKLDRGSELLIRAVEQHFPPTQPPHGALLDLGCGYGLLVLASQAWSGITERWATDNNAAAVDACRHNCEARNLPVQITPDDCGQAISRHFDVILCNPPFHQGFDVDTDLTRKFLQSTRRLLKPDGIAFWVVNQFIPVEKLASGTFAKVVLLTQQDGFKVFALTV